MSPAETNQTIDSNNNIPESEPQHRSWWPLWLLGGLILLFLIMIIILRGLCTDVWYINLLGLNDKLCGGQSSLQQNVSLEDGSIRGPEIAEGAISLDNLSPSLQLTLNNINNQLANPVPGPQGATGASGFNGAAGANGSTGPQGPAGPAGPTDPCVTNGTYFCQNGNNYGTLAVLGTNDAQDLEVITDGLSNTVFDQQGNLVVNRTEETTGFSLVVDSLTNSNVFINQDQTFDSVLTSSGSSLFGGTNSNFLAVSDSFLTDVGGSTGVIFSSSVYGSLLNGSIVNANIDNLVGLTGGFWGGSATNSFGLNGLFLTTEVNNSSYIMGNFQEGICIPILGPCPPPTASIITNSNNILGMSDGTSITSSGRLIVSGVDSTILTSNDSLLSVSNSSVESASNSIVNGSFLTLANISSSNLTGGLSTIDSLTAWHGNIAASDVGRIFVGNGAIAFSNIEDIQGFYGGMTESNVTGDVGELWGEFFRADIDNSLRLVGMFGERGCGLPAPTCPVVGPNSQIWNSAEVLGVASKTNIYDSTGLLLYTSSSDPTLLMSSLTDVNSSSVTGVDVTVSDTDYSQVIGDNNSIGSLLQSAVVGNDIAINATLNTPVNTNNYISGSSLTLNGIIASNLIGLNSEITDSGLINAVVQDSTITTSFGLTGAVTNNTTVTGSSGLNGYFNEANIVDSLYLMGYVNESDVNSSVNILGSVNSGSSVLSSDGGLFYLNSSTADTVTRSILGIDNSSVSNTESTIAIGSGLDISGLDHSIVIGDDITILDPGVGSYDYSFLGSDSAGNINTRINSKGDDSWLNLSGGSVGVGTNTPTGVAASGNLETTGGIRVGALDAATATNVCIDVDGDLSACSSSERYKENIQDLGLGLDTIMSLRAVSFDWKGTGQNDFGFVAEEVAALNGLLATYNKDGEVQGVKYDQLTAILTNAIQEQQGKLEGINTQLAEQGLRIDSLAEDLKALAGRVENLEQQFEQYKLETEARIRELERRTGGSLDGLPVEPGAQPVPAN